ncbi:type III-B CRISPR-associated protein Cas10/Cmr2 [Roseospira visakhapatnamensis]|uniref:CRISPR-associated protein Cmr2 n=1 Tax=Roseospira visakhapatnamensis TaxID=390880 RepID=A0A7W6WA69_9PROT|nr:type III-B CRISPR-associated protein Cas10/Cmr2 [Roseospira visakhapatnamensis]MBB4266674.1 CRISPR-associated protein Cmr2 [Roseospira visakhapatnamensis]
MTCNDLDWDALRQIWLDDTGDAWQAAFGSEIGLSEAIRSHLMSRTQHAATQSPLSAKDSVSKLVSGADAGRSLGRKATDRAAFLRLWRGLPSQMATPSPHSSDPIRHQRDINTALAAAVQAGDGTVGLLTLAAGPVQGFIAAARSLRDLWTGSAVLSWLTFQAMQPVIDALGPTASVFPSLRGNPLMDVWLIETGMVPNGLLSRPSAEALMAPSLPNRCLAVVPWGKNGTDAANLARACEEAAKAAMDAVASAVRREIDTVYGTRFPGWDGLWHDQVSEMLHVQAIAVPLDVSDDTLKCLCGSNPTDRWSAVTDLAARVLAARRSVRPVPVPKTTPAAGAVPKCTLLGTWEQVGGKDFWKTAPNGLRLKGVRIRKGEAFCAPSLVKRFAFPAFLDQALGLERADARFPDTATVAAMAWLEDADLDWRLRADRGDWSGQWLHWKTPKQGKHEDDEPCPPDVWEEIGAARIRAADRNLGVAPAYYAILAADGDRMGDLLRKAMGPAEHARVSEVLGHFAVHSVRPIVEGQGRGRVIYAGGDDVLAVLPARHAMACAKALRDTFHEQIGGTLSVGLAVVHHKADLREALDAARAAEKTAKASGRDRLALTIQRRSGEHATSLLSWQDADWVPRLTTAFTDSASDRWAYRLRQLADPLDGMGDPDAMTAEIRRQIGRAETKAHTILASELSAAPADPGSLIRDQARAAVVNVFKTFCAGHVDGQGVPLSKTPLKAFAMLCQAASFLARARD